jgi:hypothetical protein
MNRPAFRGWLRATYGRQQAIGTRKSAMRTDMAALVTMAFIAFAGQAKAQTQCPELMRLRSEAAEASSRMMAVAASERCEAYTRVSMAWDAIARYASQHRQSCDISVGSMNDFEQYRREATRARDNVCAGRPVRPFPPDIIQR